MPQDRPGALDDATYAALVAYIYQENETASRSEVLTDDPDLLAAMAPPRWSRGQGGGLAPGAALPPYPIPRNPLAKTTDPTLLPGDGETKMVCRHVSGGRSWMPTFYDARSKVVYAPIVEACMDLVPVPDGERGSLSSGVRWTVVRPRPERDGNYGRLEAVNLETGETTWIAR